MPGSRYIQLAGCAAKNFGYVTGGDAHALGIPVGTMNALARRGQLDHVAHGVYRVPLIPINRLDQYKLATLWPDRRGYISHRSALDLYAGGGVSDPMRIHVTVPSSYRTHREVPALYVLHREDLPEADQNTLEGIAIVSEARAMAQALADELLHGA